MGLKHQEDIELLGVNALKRVQFELETRSIIRVI